MKYSIKISLILFIMYSFLGCKHKTKQEHVELKDIPLQLENKVSFGHFLPQRELAVLVDQEKVKLKNIPKEFIDYEIKSFTFNIAQEYYQTFKNGKLATEEFQLLQKIYNIDTTQLSKKNIPTKVYIAIGELNNGNRAVVVDTDLDFDLKDEKIQEFEYPVRFIDDEDEDFYEKHKVEFLPKVYVNYGEDNADQFVLLLDPYEGDFLNSFASEKYFLSLSIPKLKTQKVQFEDKTYVIEAKSNFTQIETHPEKLQFLIFEEQDSLATNEDVNLLSFKLNDTINFYDYDFHLKYQNENFTLINLGFNDKPIGVQEGFFLPEIKTNYLDGKMYSKKEYEGKNQLFYFWTTWSLVHLEDLAQLKQLQKEHKNLAIIGVAVDTNQGAVERMVARQNMNWKTLYAPANSKDSEQPAIQFKVMSFPTYIMVDQNQKIIKRTHHLKEVTEIL